MTVTNINHLLYAAGCAIVASLGIKQSRRTKPRKPNKPKWQKEIESEIQSIRGDISVLTEIKKGNIINERKKSQLYRRHKIKAQTEVPAVNEKLKQLIQAKAQRVRRFTKRKKFYHHNKLFTENAKKFYRELGKKTTEIKEPPNMTEVERFWTNIWEKNKDIQ